MGLESENQPSPVTQPRSETAGFPRDLFAAAFGTAIAHPLRVCLNRTPLHTSLFGPLKDLPTHWYSGLGINLLRGTLAIGTQSWGKTKIEQASSHPNSLVAQMQGMFYSASVGTVFATLIETPLIRKNAAGTHFHGPYFKFSPYLTGAYLIRELGFSIYNFAPSESLPIKLSQLTLLSAVMATSHKFAVWESTADITQKSHHTLPHLSQDGFFKTAKNIAKGNVYTHKTCRVTPPTTPIAFLFNFARVACGTNMFLYRAIHLFTLQHIIQMGRDLYPKTQQQWDFWKSKPINDQRNSAETGHFIHLRKAKQNIR